MLGNFLAKRVFFDVVPIKILPGRVVQITLPGNTANIRHRKRQIGEFLGNIPGENVEYQPMPVGVFFHLS